ncbi:flagellar FliL protein [Pseudochelatococcus lubricantis]|uniref:Flagellar protein FliL n=1 Tax=Pseudochelatococcus lubricantis TaxID=1538102 RepID=A0ABX0UZ04_9HYPH|nr:flagellar basal body-associated FliL family protein [Pseudochelatococcus lubricantis]NIJ57099.1 flagellar FliL protein [Pseudochelatococcus lubricantis]
MAELTIVDQPAAPSSGGVRAVLLAALVLTALAILLGGGIGFLMSSTIEENFRKKEQEAEAARAIPSTLHYNGDIMLVKLKPITTNLMSPDTVFIKIESSLVVDQAVRTDGNLLSVLSAEISQDVLTYLRTVTLAQLQGPAGLQNLREDLNDRAAIRSGGKVREFILETMVVQ